MFHILTRMVDVKRESKEQLYEREQGENTGANEQNDEPKKENVC